MLKNIFFLKREIRAKNQKHLQFVKEKTPLSWKDERTIFRSKRKANKNT